MSQGGVFNLHLKDDRFDKVFQASAYLRTRLAAIQKQRAAAGEKITQPTFADIEKTHLLHVHSAYRPYVSVASEYMRVKPSGDGVSSIGPSGGFLKFDLPNYGHFTSDVALHIRMKPLGSLVEHYRYVLDPVEDAEGAPLGLPPYVPTLYRYCDYPGVRLLKKVEFRSESTLIDDYTSDDVMAHSKFFLTGDRRRGWERCHGQSVKHEAQFAMRGYTSFEPFTSGLQTPKAYHAGFDMFIPLHFWFCRDPAAALLNEMVPNTQRTIAIELESVTNLVHSTGEAVNRLEFEAVLYVNNLYVNQEIYDIFAARLGFSLIKVHRRQTISLSDSKGVALLSQLKYPAEFLIIGFRSKATAVGFNPKWWRMVITKESEYTTMELPRKVFIRGSSTLHHLGADTDGSFERDSSVDSLGVIAHGIDIYPLMPAIYYRDYIASRYTFQSIVASASDDSYLIPLCLFPGKQDLSGYYNLSAGRELYINYDISGIAREMATKISAYLAVAGELETFNPNYSVSMDFDDADTVLDGIELVVSMSALNFLIRSGDKLSLMYSL